MQGEIEDLMRLRNWDRGRFGVAMRRIEVLILRGFPEKAAAVFTKEILHREPYEQATMECHVCLVLPMRIANMLQAAGYETMGAVRAAKDADLLKLTNFGQAYLDHVREVQAKIDAGQFAIIPDYAGCEPDWD
jgi:DNA-directed RNA polymerase alpha subunit